MWGRDGTDGQGLVALPTGVAVVGAAVLVVGLVVAGAGLLGAGGPWSTLDVIGDDHTGTDTPATGTSPGTDTPTPGTSTQNATPAPLPPGERLEGTRSLADADVVVEGSGNDELGYAAAAGDVNGDGTPDVVLGAPFHNASAVRSGAVFVFFGPVTPGNLTVADADVRLAGGSQGDWAGNSVDVGDVDGDGVGDLVVGAPRDDEGGDNTGAVYVVHGGTDLDRTVPLESADVKLVGDVSGSLAGYSVAAGNVTGDGAADLVIGAPRGEESPGHAYVVDGRRAASAESLAEATATLVGENAGDEAGWRVAVGRNLTGNGGPAVVVGAPWNAAAGENAGTAYAVAAPFEGRTSLGDAALILRGPAAGSLAGWSVAAPGDVDGDGQQEVLVGAMNAGPGGAAYLVDAGTGERSLANATALGGAAAGDRAGWVVDGTGDLTCDGRPDVLVGAPQNDTGGENAGAVYLVGGSETTDLTNATATLVGAAPGDKVGRADALATVPGENATGLVVGAPFGDPPQTAHVVYAACPEG